MPETAVDFGTYVLDRYLVSAGGSDGPLPVKGKVKKFRVMSAKKFDSAGKSRGFRRFAGLPLVYP
jgi:hypothetical protein